MNSNKLDPAISQEIYRLSKTPLTVKEIAAHCGVTVGTVRRHSAPSVRNRRKRG